MTIGTVTMSYFGWITICMEMICITLKDCYLWKYSLKYRYGVKKGIGAFVIFGTYILAEIGSEICGLTGKMSMVMFFLVLLLFLMYFFTENGLECMGRTLIYWLVCYVPWIVLEYITKLFPMSEGSVDYYETPEWVLPNICILLIAFFTMKYLWKRRVLHWIPKEFCVALTLFANSTEYVRFMGTAGKNKTTLTEILEITVILLGYTCIALGMVMFYSSRQKRKMHLAVQCRKLFYQQVCKAQKEAGKFRHDLANHIQVLNTYGMRQDIEEKEKYAKKLNERKQELQIQTYSGNVIMDFILNQIQNMAESNGCRMSVQWTAGEVTYEEIEKITGNSLEYMAKRYRWWRLYKRVGKRKTCQLTVLRTDEQISASKIAWGRGECKRIYI